METLMQQSGPHVSHFKSAPNARAWVLPRKFAKPDSSFPRFLILLSSVQQSRKQFQVNHETFRKATFSMLTSP
ncbi:hypothetical protein CCR75_005268 [Bremia lactucae]|uniref:Uncharacterized protein n=1 Tax=Bremia lactucae TaxID=4779 RepID=A0A976IE31_BRELC|nr:hypothetical protein CCR75_005268 [Bremia lactucae]